MSTQMMAVPTTMPLEGRGLALFTVAVVWMSISIMAVILRSFVRLYLVRAYGWDDTLMVFALALFIFFAVTCIIGPEHGVGHKLKDFTSITMFETALKWWWLGQLFYILSSVVAKISIALALLRLTVRPIHRILLWSIIGVIIAFGLMFFFVLLLECNPISYFWTRFSPTTAPGKCIAVDIIVKIAYLYSSVTIVCDLTLGIFPIFLILQLQMDSRTKLALAGILSLGAVASVAVIIRLPFLHYYKDTEFLYSTYQIAIWSVIETGIGITAGSLVTLRPLFRWCLDGSVSYRRGYNTSGKRSTGRYPLSSLTGDGSKKSQNPSHWRPDIDLEEPHNVVVTAVSSPTRQNHLSDANSSQEDLNPSPNSWDSRKHVNIHKTFVVTQERPLA